MTSIEPMTDVERQNRALKQLLIDADAVAKLRGDRYGLCDSEAHGQYYPSSAIAIVLQNARIEGFTPLFSLEDALSAEKSPNSPWHESIRSNQTGDSP